jgi:hypothetical protein
MHGVESVAERFRRNEIAELLARYPGLRLVPSGSMTLRVGGTLRFSANSKKTEVIEHGYDIRIEASKKFPERMALAWETGGRIPPDYHKLMNGALCLGSRVRLRLQMGGSPSLLRFVERCVIPYLYGHSYSVKHGPAATFSSRNLPKEDRVRGKPVDQAARMSQLRKSSLTPSQSLL